MLHCKYLAPGLVWHWTAWIRCAALRECFQSEKTCLRPRGKKWKMARKETNSFFTEVSELGKVAKKPEQRDCSSYSLRRKASTHFLFWLFTVNWRPFRCLSLNCEQIFSTDEADGLLGGWKPLFWPDDFSMTGLCFFFFGRTNNSTLATQHNSNYRGSLQMFLQLHADTISLKLQGIKDQHHNQHIL